MDFVMQAAQTAMARFQQRKEGQAMPKLAIIVTIEVTTGRRDQLLPLLMAHRARCLKDEPGITLLLEVLAPYEDDTKVLTYEVYRDDAAFETHQNGRSLAQFREDTAGMIGKIQVRKCALLAGQLV
jgi:(4S)-4-hydroxy-5-phosphonooxypentane-2,3-dione isomerase